MTLGRGAVELVMVSHLAYPRWDEAPVPPSPVAVEVLRREISFRGVVTTDDLGIGPLAGMDPCDVLDRAITAGVDLLRDVSALAPPAALMAHRCRRVADGTVAEARVKASARRVLRLKARHT